MFSAAQFITRSDLKDKQHPITQHPQRSHVLAMTGTKICLLKTQIMVLIGSQ